MKKKISIVVGVFIIYVLIALVFGFLHFQESSFKETPPDFLYAHGGDLSYGYPYELDYDAGLTLKKNEVDYPSDKMDLGEVKLYIHDSIENETDEITFEEAKKLQLFLSDYPPKFEIVTGGDLLGETFIPGKGFYLYGTEGNTPKKRYLRETEGPGLMKLNVVENVLDYFTFIAWIEE